MKEISVIGRGSRLEGQLSATIRVMVVLKNVHDVRLCLFLGACTAIRCVGNPPGAYAHFVKVLLPAVWLGHTIHRYFKLPRVTQDLYTCDNDYMHNTLVFNDGDVVSHF